MQEGPIPITKKGLEKLQTELKELQLQHEGEKTKLQQMRGAIGDTVKRLQGEIDALRPARDAAAKAVPAQTREAFERLADRYEGEAMAALERPDRRREEYACTACNMDLVTDIYNKLHTRDELVFCPNCRRMLYIPDELPPELALNTKPPRKAVTASTEAEE